MINMMGHVSGPFVTHAVTLNRYAFAVVDYEPSIALSYTDSFSANIQPASDREIEFLSIGGERINDVRKIHRNDGLGIRISTPEQISDVLIFSEDPVNIPATWWKCINVDYRPWHNYCRAFAVKLDPSEIAKLQANELNAGIAPVAAELDEFANDELPAGQINHGLADPVDEQYTFANTGLPK